MKTVISVKTDLSTKKAAQEVVKAAGLNLSTVINAYLHQLVATRRIEFYAPEQMSPKLESLIAEVEAEISAGNVSATYDTVDAFLEDLKS